MKAASSESINHRKMAAWRHQYWRKYQQWRRIIVMAKWRRNQWQSRESEMLRRRMKASCGVCGSALAYESEKLAIMKGW